MQMWYVYFFFIFTQVQGQSCHLHSCLFICTVGEQRDTERCCRNWFKARRGTVFITVCKDPTYMNKLLHAGEFSLYRSYSHNWLVALPACAHIYKSTYWKSDRLLWPIKPQSEKHNSDLAAELSQQA